MGCRPTRIYPREERLAPVTRIPRLLLPAPYFLLCLCLFAIGPLLRPGYFWDAHDAKNSLYFLFEFDKSIRDGILWPRWGPDWAFGYGYPFWNIYGPLAYYVGEAIHLLGFDLIDALKITFALSVFGSALSMYLFVGRLMGEAAGLIAGLVYVYAPYHLFDIYVRAALAESFAFVFVPLVLWGFYELAVRPRLTAVIGAAAAYAALILTSNVLLVLMTPLVGLLVIWLAVGHLKDERPTSDGAQRGVATRLRLLLRMLAAPAAGLALGLGLMAIFLLPALFERNYVRLDQWFGGRYTFGRDFVYFFQLFSPCWGFGASVAGPDDQVGFQLGLAPLVLFALSFVAAPRLASTQARRVLRFFQVATLLAAFLMTPASAWVWYSLPVLQAVQFPWRLGVITTTCLAISAGATLGLTRRVAQSVRPADLANLISSNLSTVILALLVVLASYPYLQAQMREARPEEGPPGLANLFRYQQASDEMTGVTAWVRRVPGWSALAEQVIQGGTIDTRVNYTAIPPDQRLGVHSLEMDSVHELVWVYAADDQQAVTFMIPYYPGWTATVYADLKEPAEDLKARLGPPVASPTLRVTEDEGWLVVPVPAGEHFLEVRFQDTPVRVVGKIISLASLLAACAALGYRYLHTPAHDQKAG